MSLDKNQQNNLLDEIVITKFEIFPKLLETIKQNPKISQNKLRIKSTFSGGKIYHGIKALKLMNLINNGDGLIITDFGNRFLIKYLENKKIPQEEIREACLNVPIFNKIYSTYKDVTKPTELFKIFEKELKEKYPNLNEKLIGSSIRRYLEGIHNIKLIAGARTGSSFAAKKRMLESNGSINFNKYNGEIINSLKNLKKVLKLSDKEMHILINNLPEEKREVVISQIFSKVFKH